MDLLPRRGGRVGRQKNEFFFSFSVPFSPLLSSYFPVPASYLPSSIPVPPSLPIWLPLKSSSFHLSAFGSKTVDFLSQEMFFSSLRVCFLVCPKTIYSAALYTSMLTDIHTHISNTYTTHDFRSVLLLLSRQPLFYLYFPIFCWNTPHLSLLLSPPLSLLLPLPLSRHLLCIQMTQKFTEVVRSLSHTNEFWPSHISHTHTSLFSLTHSNKFTNLPQTHLWQSHTPH